MSAIYILWLRELKKYTRSRVQVVASLGSDAELTALFDLLLFDRRRLRDRLLLSELELRRHHRSTFFYSLNLTLVACGAELRAAVEEDLAVREILIEDHDQRRSLNDLY